MTTHLYKMTPNSKICVTPHGHTYVHDIQERDLRRTIYTNPVSSKRYQTHLDELAKKKKEPQQPDLLKSFSKLHETAVKCMVVGLVLGRHCDPRVLRKAAPDTFKQRPVGVEIPKSAIACIPDTKTPPYLAVVEVRENMPPGGAKMFALVDTHSQLPCPFSVSQNEVFYFHEFRDLSTSYEARRFSWNKLVLLASVKNHVAPAFTATVAEKAIESVTAESSNSHSGDSNKRTTDVTSELSNEPPKQPRSTSGAQDSAMDVSASQSPTSQNTPPAPHHNLSIYEPMRMYLALNEDFDEEDALDLVNAANILWPGPELSAFCIFQTRNAIKTEGITVKGEALREYLILCHYFIGIQQTMRQNFGKVATLDDQDFVEIAKLAAEAAETIAKSIDNNKSGVCFETRYLFNSIQDITIEILGQAKEAKKHMKRKFLSSKTVIRKAIDDLGLSKVQKLAARSIALRYLKEAYDNNLKQNRRWMAKISTLNSGISQVKYD